MSSRVRQAQMPWVPAFHPNPNPSAAFYKVRQKLLWSVLSQVNLCTPTIYYMQLIRILYFRNVCYQRCQMWLPWLSTLDVFQYEVDILLSPILRALRADVGYLVTRRMVDQASLQRRGRGVGENVLTSVGQLFKNSEIYTETCLDWHSRDVQDSTCSSVSFFNNVPGWRKDHSNIVGIVKYHNFAQPIKICSDC